MHAPTNEREKNLTKRQKGRQKDIERMFGVIQGRFKIVRHEIHEWSASAVILIRDVCVIIHNVIV